MEYKFYDLVNYLLEFFKIVLLILLILLIIYIIFTKKYRWICILAQTYKRDYRGIQFVRITKNEVSRVRNNNYTLYTLFSETVHKHLDKTAVIYENEVWTYSKLYDFVNKVSNYFSSESFVKGDCIALFLENCPEFFSIIIGLSKLGVIVSLINTNLVSNSLVYSVQVAKCKALIFGSSLAHNVNDIVSLLPRLKLYQLNDAATNIVLDGAINLQQVFRRVWKEPLPANVQVNAKDSLLYIYTSGTTGLPKAVIVTHIRFLSQTLAFKYVFTEGVNNILYNPLPLYHAFGLVGISLSTLLGVTSVIKKKFSARSYFEDCAKHGCTIKKEYLAFLCFKLHFIQEEFDCFNTFFYFLGDTHFNRKNAFNRYH
ncbi:hypothetical protein FQA39_LY14171 [Lamprigera yunnana]|nr:hypothetical protein FQA39_LY14171 [Lamprigera yunnana]